MLNFSIRGRIEKAKIAIARRKEELSASGVTSSSSSASLSATPTSKKDEPEAKRRRQDMGDQEGKVFDNWIEEIKQKRFDACCMAFNQGLGSP